MARILIRDLDDKTVKRLKDRARRHRRSLEGEARLILTQAAGISFEDAQRLAKQWHKKLAGRKLPDSTELIREDRRR
jgi:plasmid stability protein